MTDPAQPNNSPPPSTPPGSPPPGATPPAAWYPEPHKDYVESKGWKTPADALDSYVNLEKLIGAEKAGRTVVLPKDANDVEGRKAFLAKIGVPDTADAYELPVPAGEGAEFAKTAASWFHENGVPKAAAQAIAQQWNAFVEQQVKADQDAAAAASAEELGKLKGEWGPEFDKRAEYARRFLTAAGWDAEKMQKYEQAFGTATMLKDFYQWGTKIGEPDFATGGSSGGFTPQKAAVQKQIDEVRQKRIANQITEAQFFAEMSVLGPKLDAA